MEASYVIPPVQLAEWRFVKLKGKKAFEPSWTTVANYTIDQIQSWTDKGNNYGVLCDEGHFVVDIDNHGCGENTDLLGRITTLPSTMVVRTGGGGIHCYYTGNLQASHRLLNPSSTDQNLGDIQGPGKQVVGPGSIHPRTGTRYVVEQDNPIANIENADEVIHHTFDPYLTHSVEPSLLRSPPPVRIEQYSREAYNQSDSIDISKIVDLSQLTPHGDEYFGSHPVHGSTTGQNFWVNPSKGIFHCFRHGTGGGPFHLLAIKEGIIRCEDSCPSILKGHLFLEVLEAAREQGLLANSNKTDQPGAWNTDGLEEWLKQNRTLPIEDWIMMNPGNKDFYIDQVLSADHGDYVDIVGRTGLGKTNLALHMAYCLATGTDWFGLKTEQAKVIYLSFEGSPSNLKDRIQKIKQHFPNPNKNLGFNSLDPLHLDRRRNLDRFESLIEGYQVVIVDNLRQIAFENWMRNEPAYQFVNLFQKILIDTGAVGIMTHHIRKPKKDTYFAEYGEVYETKGPAEYVELASSVILLERKKQGRDPITNRFEPADPNKYILSFAKKRYAVSLPEELCLVWNKAKCMFELSVRNGKTAPTAPVVPVLP